MPTIHELLDDTQKKCEILTKEIETFKSARSLNQKTVDVLDALCKSLQETINTIAPLAEYRIRQMMIVILITTSINFILFLIIFVVLILKLVI